MSNFTIAVTGATGRVGSAVVTLALAEGHTVVGIDRDSESKTPPHERYTYKSANLMDFDAYKSAAEGCDALIHLAAVWNSQDPDGKLIEKVKQHVVYNTNTTMSYNALSVAAALGIDRIVLASSVNAIGLVFSKRPHFDYLPVDEKHPYYPEDAYSLSKQVVEVQSAGFARVHPSMRIATLRFHFVAPDNSVSREALHTNGTKWNDLWGWVSTTATARSCLLGLTAPESKFPKGHEAFFIVAPTICRQESTRALLKEAYPEIKDVRGKMEGNEGLFNCEKAERMLGWTETGFEWRP